MRNPATLTAAALVVLVVGFAGLREVAQYRLGRAARIHVDARPVDVRLEPFEDLQVVLDASMAREQHLERIVESHRRIEKARARVPFHPRATGARAKGCSAAHAMRSAITT